MTPSERRAVVVGLLDHWPDFFEPKAGGPVLSGIDPQGPSGIALISSMSTHPSVLEMLRLLKGLREQGPRHYAAVQAWFDSPWRTVDRPIKRRNAHGKLVDATARVRERVAPSWLQRYPGCRCGCGFPRPVCTAIDVLGYGWDRKVALEMPPLLLAKLRPLADADGWTEAA